MAVGTSNMTQEIEYLQLGNYWLFKIYLVSGVQVNDVLSTAVFNSVLSHYLFVVHKKMLSACQPTVNNIKLLNDSEQWAAKGIKGSGHDLTDGIIPAYSWRKLRSPWKPQCSSQDSNWAPSDKSEAMPLQWMISLVLWIQNDVPWAYLLILLKHLML
jgi:hypothetical protein